MAVVSDGPGWLAQPTDASGASILTGGFRARGGDLRPAPRENRLMPPTPSERFPIGICHVDLVQARLERLPAEDRVEVLVSSDDNYLTHGGGVSRALWRAGGVAAVARGLEELLPVGLGDVVRGDPGELDASHLLHAVTIDLDLRRRLEPRGARRLYGRVLDRTRELGARSVALPMLGAGAGRLTAATSATALAEAMSERWIQVGALDRVVLVGFDTESFDAAAHQLRPRSGPLFDLPSLVAACRPHLSPEGSARLDGAAKALLGSPEPAVLAGALDGFLTAFVERNLSAVPWEHRGRLGERALEFLEQRDGHCTLNRDGVTLGDLGRLVLVTQATLQRPLTKEEVEAIQVAISARNRLVHGGHDTAESAAPLALEMLVGVRQLGLLMLQDKDTTHAEAVRSAGAMWSTVGTALASDFAGGAAAGAVLAGLGAPAVGAAIGGGLVSLATKKAMKALLRRHSVEKNQEQAAHLTESSPERRHAEPHPTPRPPPAQPPADGTGPVRALHRFLLQIMDEDLRAEWGGFLEERGYRGSLEFRLLEFCVRMEDPAQFLADQLSGRELRIQLKERSIDAALNIPARRAAELLLGSFGFPTPSDPIGLASVRQRLDQLQAASRAANDHALRGTVIEAGNHLEFAARILLHFICRAVFEQPPEVFLKALGAMKDDRPLEKHTLGSLLSFLERLTKEVTRRAEAGEPMKLPQLEARRLVPRGTHEITRLRNSFAHFTSLDDDIDPLRSAADRFFKDACGWLQYLNDPAHRVFPHVIRISQIRIDDWGRRTISGLADSGLTETLFTDLEVRAGERYFMHPLSNPLRVDPVLVPAGELLDVEG